MNILIVDDEPIILNGLRRLIDEWEGYCVIGCVDDGETALEWLENAEVMPDLMLTDIFMQYIDGLDLIEQVNQLYPGIKCVILSGHGEFHLAQKAIDLKVSRYITKPVDPTELFSFLNGIRAELQTEREHREAESFTYPFEQERKLRLAFRMCQQNELTLAANEFMDQLVNQNKNGESILQGSYKLMESISSLFKESGASCPSYPPLSHVPVSIAIDRMKRWLEVCMSEQLYHKSHDTIEPIDKVTMFMKEHYADPSLSLQQLADLVSLHPNHFTQLFRKITGLSCMQFLAQLRMEKAKELLQQTDLKISEVAERVGYENPLYFSSYFKKWVGLNPSEFKERVRTNG